MGVMGVAVEIDLQHVYVTKNIFMKCLTVTGSTIFTSKVLRRQLMRGVFVADKDQDKVVRA